MTAGTAKSFLSMMNKPYLARQNGDLVTRPFGADTLEMPLLETDALAVAVPWGDLVTSYHSTGIPNIKTYMTLSPVVIRAMRLLSPLLKATLGSKLLSGFASRLAEMTQRGPSRQDRETLATLIWARARNANGQSAEAWLDTMEVYQFTAAAAIPVVEQILEQSPIGALTPAQALGVDFPLRLPDTRRYDSLEELENAEVG